MQDTRLFYRRAFWQGSVVMKLNIRIRRFILKFFGKDKVYYINGSETLPAPLEPAEEEKMIANIGCDWARQTLIEHNLRLVVYIAKRFENTGAGIEELISIGTVGLIKAVDSFNADFGTRFATYGARCVQNAILS